MKKLIRITTVPYSFRTLLKGQAKFMKQHYEVVAISSGGPGLQEVIDYEKIKAHHVEMTRSITPFKDLVAAYKLYKVIKKEKPFIVHTHTPKAGTLGMLAARLAKVPHRLHTIAGLPLLEARGAKRLLLNTVEKFTYGCATMVLPNSFAMEKIVLQQKFTSASKLKVIGHGSSNGIDVNHYDAEHIAEGEKSALREQLGIKTTDFVYIFIGRIVKDKGINELIQAFDAISKSDPNCKLLILGDREDELDPLLPETESLINENKAIIDVGFQRDIRPFLTISNVLTFPSYREGFPNVVMQASCMSLPCIVTNINGCNEIIEDDVNGIIIPVKDVAALESAMQHLKANPEKIEAMKPFTRKRIKERYQQEFVWNELLKLYKNLEDEAL